MSTVRERQTMQHSHHTAYTQCATEVTTKRIVTVHSSVDLQLTKSGDFIYETTQKKTEVITDSQINQVKLFYTLYKYTI